MRLVFRKRAGWTVFLSGILLLPIASAAAQRGRGARLNAVIDPVRTGRYEFKEAGRQQEYSLFVPPNYKPEKKAPLIVALHGLGGTPRQILGTRGFTDLAEKHGFILVAPYGYNDHGWYGIPQGGRGASARPDDPPNLTELSEKDVLNVLAIVRKDFNIDSDRIYLMGHSMGGGGTWHIAIKHPEIWAAIAPISPATLGQPMGLEGIRSLPVIVVHGDKDETVSVAGTRRWVARMKELGMKYTYIEVAGGTHGSVVAPNLSKIFDFFKKHPRQTAAPRRP
jgi:poly(3-hydroxybutyrate) depolymerase